MTINEELIKILCCPKTKKPVRILPEDKLAVVNRLITEGKIKDAEGNIVDQQLQGGLITEDDLTIYRIDEGIPVMLIPSGIPTGQIDGF